MGDQAGKTGIQIIHCSFGYTQYCGIVARYGQCQATKHQANVGVHDISAGQDRSRLCYLPNGYSAPTVAG